MDPTTRKAAAKQARLTTAVVVLATLALGTVFPPAWLVSLIACFFALSQTRASDYVEATCLFCGERSEVKQGLDHYVCDHCGARLAIDVYTGRVRPGD